MEDRPHKKGWPRIFKLLLVVAVPATLLILLRHYDVHHVLRNLLETISAQGAWAPVAFSTVYIAATVLLLPGFILTLGAGFLFGVVWGSVVVSISSVLGATGSFLIARYLARDWVTRKMRGHEKFKPVDEAVAREGWKIVGLTRLSPIFPFNLLNYAFGITQVSLRDYILASWIGMMPATVMYVYIGSLAGNLATLGSEARARTHGDWALYLIGLLPTIAVTVFVTRLARQALEKRVS